MVEILFEKEISVVLLICMSIFLLWLVQHDIYLSALMIDAHLLSFEDRVTFIIIAQGKRRRGRYKRTVMDSGSG